MSTKLSTAIIRGIRQTSCRVTAKSVGRNFHNTSRIASGFFVGVQDVIASVASSNQLQSYPSSFSRQKFTTTAAEEEEKIIPGVGKGKTSTGIVGLAVEPDWYNVMLKKFQLLLDTLETSDMPETAQYRIDVTKWANFVIATVKANPEDPEKVEEEVRMGQVEELIEMADDEYDVMKDYIKTRLWEAVERANHGGEGPEVDYNPDPMKDDAGPDADPRTRKAIEEDLRRMAMAGVEDGDDDEEENEYAEYEYGEEPKFRGNTI